MLKLKVRHMFNPFRNLGSGGAQLEFSPVPSEDNELIQAIEQAAKRDQWTLSATPDTEQLHDFWSNVQDDLADDPSWSTFSE